MTSEPIARRKLIVATLGGAFVSRCAPGAIAAAANEVAIATGLENADGTINFYGIAKGIAIYGLNAVLPGSATIINETIALAENIIATAKLNNGKLTAADNAALQQHAITLTVAGAPGVSLIANPSTQKA